MCADLLSVGMCDSAWEMRRKWRQTHSQMTVGVKMEAAGEKQCLLVQNKRQFVYQRQQPHWTVIR